MEAPAVMEMVAKFEAEIPPAVEILTKEGVAVTEEDAAMALSDGIFYISRTGGSLAELPEVMNAEAESIMATGELLGGGTGNFMNAMYQFFATNQVSAQFIMDNADFFTTFFSWLGADLEQYDDYPRPATNDGEAFRFDGYDLTLPPITFSDVTVDMGGWVMRQGYTFDYMGSTYYSVNPLMFHVNDETGALYLESSRYDKVSYDRVWNGDRWVKSSNVVPNVSVSELGGFVSGGNVFVQDECKYFNPDAPGAYSFQVYDYATGQWDLTRGSIVDVSVGESPTVSVVGADAQYDDAGNITDYGNVSVPDVTSPDYQAPGSWAEALAQMQATATTENPAHADSPAFGQTEGTTVKDWTETNKPSDPAPSEDARDAFKVADLEKVFPFCIPWDLYYLLSALAAEPEAPNVVWTFDFAGLGKHELPIDLSPFEPVAQVVRVGEVLAFCVGLALVTRDLVRG